MKKTVLIAVLALVLGVSSASAQGGKTSGAAYQHKAGAAATQKANAASLKKGEPRLNASTTTTNVYNVSATDTSISLSFTRAALLGVYSSYSTALVVVEPCALVTVCSITP